MLEAYGLEGTLFVTHDSPILDEIRQMEHVELGVHPNFLPGSSHGSTPESVMAHMQKLVPEATGVRAHCLVRGTPFLQLYNRLGYTHDASDLYDGVDNLKPFLSWTGVWRIPIWWEDDVFLQRHPRAPIPTRLTECTPSETRVINIHPVLHALNASDVAGYAALKSHLARTNRPLTQATPNDFSAFRDVSGIGDALTAFCKTLAKHRDWAGGKLSRALPHAANS